MHVTKLVVAVDALLLALIPTEGLLAIPTRQENVLRILPTIKKNNNIIYYHRSNKILRSSTASLEYTSSSIENISVEKSHQCLNRVQSKIVYTLMISYIISMCFALPLTLFPVYLLYKAKLISRVRKEKWVRQTLFTTCYIILFEYHRYIIMNISQTMIWCLSSLGSH